MRRFKGQKRNQLSALAVAIHLGFSATAWSATPLPQGATVVNGQVQITKPSDNSLLINASAGSIVNWQQFSIGSNGQVRFTLPSASSSILNRVVGTDASQLLGALQSNGRVFLINSNGIVVGAGARIDANSFIGSTLDLSDSDFLAGKLRFLAAPGAGSIRNDGVISAGPGGRIALIAPDIQNTGIIQAPDGQILLAAGRKLEISSLDFEGVSFEIQAPTDAVLNLGKLLAESGAVSAFAGTLRHSGEIRASGMVLDHDGSVRLVGRTEVVVTSGSVTVADGIGHGGSITIQSGAGTSRVAGSLSATASEGSGGSIAVLGERVALEAGARLDASGASGGGQILVGGDFQGKNAAVQNASRVYVDADARLQADAGAHGDGGKVVVWADANTRFFGSLSARGGALGGNGGQAEVSGKQNLVFAGSADLGAAQGKSGSLLLDPLDILVSNTGGILPTVVDQFADFSGNVVTLSPTAMNNIKGNVTLQAARDIYFNDSVALTTSGAGLSATAGGSTFDAAGGGQIYLNQAISTTGGGVTLRAVGISGSGTLSTQGGAVDIKTSGSAGYTAAISSAGGAVSVESQTGSVSLGDVNAGSGNITVTTTTGSIYGGNLSAATVNLAATGGAVSNVHVNAANQVNASSGNASVFLYNLNSQALRLGTLSAASDLYLTSDSGFTQATGGLLTAPRVTLSNQNSSASAGSAAAPLSIASPRLVVDGVAAPVFVAFSGTPTLTELRLSGTLAGLSASSLGGAANLSSLALGTAGATLSISADSGATSGFGSGFVVSVTDAGITAPSLNLTGGNVTLSSASTLDIGTLSATSLYATAKGAVNLGTVTTASGGSGINVSTQSCLTSYVGCSASSPITATTLTAGGSAPVNLSTYDNGDISISGSLTAGSATLTAGNSYSTTASYPYYSMRTANSITVASASTSGSFTLNDRGSGSVTLGSLAATGGVSLNAGGSSLVSDPAFPSGKTVTTTNTIAVTAAEPATPTGSFQVSNSGVGNVSVTGAVTRPSGSIGVSASNGSVTSSGDLSASSSVNVSAGSNALTVAHVTASNGTVTLSAGGDLLFDSVTASLGSVNLSSSSGSIKARADNATADITAASNVSLNANGASGVLGDAAFAHPLDIVASAASSTVTLSAGQNIGAAGKPVRVDTGGLLSVASTAGNFYVAATSMADVAKTLTGIQLSASAAGIGAGGSSSLSSQDLSVTASSNGTDISIGNILQSVNALNQFSFTSTGGGLNFGNVNLATSGYNQVLLTSAGALTQTNPLTSNNISGGYIKLSAGSNALTVGHVTSSSAGANSVGNLVEISGGTVNTGDLSGPGVKVSGAALNLGSVTATGTNRGYYGYYLYVPRLGSYQYVTDELRLTATGALSTSGNISSATSAVVAAAGVTVAGGTGSITGGHTDTYYYADKIDLQSGSGNVAVGALNGYDVSVTGANITTGAVTANRTLSLGGASTVLLSSGALLASGPVVAYGSPSLTLNAGSISTGNASTTGALSITANALGAQTYALGAIGLTAASTTITAANGMDLTSTNMVAATSLTSPTVSLNSTTGNITAPLSGTTSLTLNTGGKFSVSSTGALSSLSVTADGATAGAGVSAGAGSSVSDASNSVVMSLVDSVPNVAGAQALTVSPSSGSTAYRYTESNSAITALALSTGATLAAGSSITVSTPSAQVSTPNISMAGGSLTVSTGGDVNLSSVATGGGGVNVFSSSGTVNLTSVSTLGGAVVARSAGDATKNVNVVAVDTLGGSVSLTADNGSISGTGALAIDLRNAAGGASGTLTLVAEQGSIGSAATPLQTSGAVTLDARAKNDIEVSVANTALSNLYLTTLASGSGAVHVVNSNYAGLSLTRTAGTELDLSGLNPTASGAFSLTARDGNINVKSDVGNVNNLSLVATTGDVAIAGSGAAARTVSASGSMTLQAGRDVLVAAGALAAESVAVQSDSTMTVSAGRDIRVKGDGASALLKQATAFNSQNLNAGRDISVIGGGTANASATVLSFNGYQTLNATGNLLVQGGTASGAFATVQTGTTGQSQTVYANNFSVLGGADGAYASVRGGSQSLERIYGNALVQGGSGSGAYAEVASTTGAQGFGNQSSYYYASVTDGIRILGGTGAGAYAALRSAASQEVHSAGDIQVVAGAGATADAEIKAGTSQNLGGSNTYYYSATNTATGNVLVQASGSGLARVLAGGNQTLMAGGNIEVLGGSGGNTTASIESSGGSQSIGNTYVFSNDALGNITVQGGSGNGAAAWIKAASGQTIDAGGSINVLAGANGAVGSYAEVVSTVGTQTIGNRNSSSSYDATDSVTLTGGSGMGAYARLAALGGSQTVQAATAISLAGGAADDAGALLLAATGQTVASSGTLALTGGSASTAAGNESGVRNTTSGSQNVQAASGITLTGGGAGSETWIKQAGAGAQSISSAGALALLAPTVGANKVSIESGAGGQTLSTAGAISLDNAGANTVQITSGGNQSLAAQSLSIATASTTGSSPMAGVSASGDQNITLNGLDSNTPATLTLSNHSATAESRVLLEAGGKQTVAMDYLQAGLMQVGDSQGLGIARVYAGGDQTIVAGQLLVQGGANALASATLSAGTLTSGTMLISTLNGPIRVLGGAAGSAGIDPLNLGAVSNGSIVLTSGAAATAAASVAAGFINMTATNGNMAVLGGGAPATVVASTTATVAGANTFNLNNSGGLTISGGSITASAGGTVNLGGFCSGCGLVGPFTLTEVTPVTSASYSPNLLVADVLAMLDQATLELLSAGYDLVVAEDGSVTSRRRNLNQCY